MSLRHYCEATIELPSQQGQVEAGGMAVAEANQKNIVGRMTSELEDSMAALESDATKVRAAAQTTTLA